MHSYNIWIHLLVQSWGAFWLSAIYMPLTLHQLPPQRTKLLWRSPTALIQFYSPSTPGHKSCKPIRSVLFISPFRAISLTKLEINHSLVIVLQHPLSLIPEIPQQTHGFKKRRYLWIFVFKDNKHILGVFMSSNLWSTSQCGSLRRLSENCL